MSHPAPASPPAVERVLPPLPDAVSLVVIEDNRLLREGMTAMLAQEPRFSVLAATGDAERALHDLPHLRPSAILLDVGLADADSLALCARLRALVPTSRVIMMGLTAPEEDVAAFIHAGAAGFVMKDATLAELVTTIRLIVAGDEALPRALTHSLFARIVREEIATSRQAVAESVRLTARERQTIALLGEGLSNKEIAARLHISVHTVESHVHNVLEKLALHTRLEVAAFSRSPRHRDAT
jgi:DNA-binding NarL/FixJ family response regulator